MQVLGRSVLLLVLCHVLQLHHITRMHVVWELDVFNLVNCVFGDLLLIFVPAWLLSEAGRSGCWT